MSMSKPKKGDRLVYTGEYATLQDYIDLGGSAADWTPVPPYPPGEVVSFRNNRFHGPSVTVLLDRADDGTKDVYADWPIAETEPAP